MKSFLYCLSVSLLITLIQCQKCENPNPYQYSAVYNCKDVSEFFPVFIKPVTTLRCNNCSFTTIKNETINFITSRLEEFNVSNSHVHKIEANAFSRFEKNMHVFVFENSEINYIAPKVFSEFAYLDSIDLTKNNLSKFDDGTFENTNVTVLNLAYNHISNINSTFNGLRVNKLNLSHNEITDIYENTFENVIFWEGRQWKRSMQYLDLSYNSIRAITANTFKNNNDANKVVHLFLNNNKLTSVENDTFALMNKLDLLNLENNDISTLYTNSFRGLTDLKNLILGSNRLEKIPSGLFADMQKLTNLDLSNNKLTTLTISTFSGLISLQSLNISHNNLKELDNESLYPLGKLINLDISATNLKSLDVNSLLDHHIKLRMLVLNDNFWTCKDLVQMYRVMNVRTGGFNNPSHYYDVPNLHGIACTRHELQDYSDMTFDNFLNIISQDRVFEDLYDTRLNMDPIEEEISMFAISNTIKRVDGIFYMLIIITIIVIIIFLQFVVRNVFRYLYWHKNISNDKFSFMYAKTQDNVELIN